MAFPTDLSKLSPMSRAAAEVAPTGWTAAARSPKRDADAASGRLALAPGLDLVALARIAWRRVVRRRAARGRLDGAPGQVASLGGWLDESVFMACPTTRGGRDATRVVYVGELSPRGGVADFLACAIAWAERAPGTPVEICWAGRGDLREVLRAQPVPANLTQVFVDPATPEDHAALFARAGLLVVPSLSRVPSPYFAEAMAAGLPVLGSIRGAHVRGLVTQHETGWLFDPLRADQMLAALDAALTTPAARLDEMRVAARARIRAPRGARAGEDEGIGRTPWTGPSALARAADPARA
jgi:glycosyltransferase involved in cell wall biosynthesis